MNNQPYEEDAEELYQQAPFGYLTMQSDGLIVNINTTLLKWLGYNKSDVINTKSFQDLLGMGEKIYFETHIMPLLQMQGEIAEINIELKAKDLTKLPTLVNAKQVTGRFGLQHVYRLSVLNISQRKQYEVELMKAKKELAFQNDEKEKRSKELLIANEELAFQNDEKNKRAEELLIANKELAFQNDEKEKRANELNIANEELVLSNAELEQFAFVASHDLQEPLRMISSFLMLLEKKYENVLDDNGKMYIGFAVDGAKRMQQIILDLLKYSRAGRTEEEKEELDLSELIDEIKLLLGKTIEEKQAVFIIDQLPTIHAYKASMLQVFQNLINNALKYTNNDIPVQIHIEVKALEHHWQFAVIDNGIGIEKEYFDKIFIIFKRLHTKEEYPGTGMGLAIIKKIIEMHGGKIWVESEKGKGSTFYFTIKK